MNLAKILMYNSDILSHLCSFKKDGVKMPVLGIFIGKIDFQIIIEKF
jgi:hypothetical protein